MSEPLTIIHIIAECPLGCGITRLCDNRETAIHYLAQLAAKHSLPLDANHPGRSYQIGDVQYILTERRVLSIEDVNAIRQTHEG